MMTKMYVSNQPCLKVTGIPNYVWHNWTTQTASTSTTSSYTTDIIWGKWTNQTNISLSSTWDTWNRIVVIPERIERTRQEAVAAQAKRIEERQFAQERAQALLLENLTESQKASYERHGYFFVRSQHGRRYKIITSKGYHNNIFEVDRTGKHVKELCGAPSGLDLPVADKFLGQKLALEFAESEFLAKANVWDLIDDRRHQPLCNTA